MLFGSIFSYGQPVITSFTPASGPVGASVTITGSNFNTTPANNIVYFGAVKANVTASTATSLTVTVPTGATYQPITVTVGGLTAYSTTAFVVSFPNGFTITSSSFEPKTDHTTDLHPNDIAIADFDGDGKPDMVTANNYISGVLSSISVLRNTSITGTVSFAPKQDFTNGAGSYGIAAGDIDGDGKPDIVVNSNFDSKVSVFRNTSVAGTISFAPKVDLTSGSNAYAIVIRDVDGDGKSDISFINNISGGLSVYRNTGSIGTIAFAARQDFATALTPYDLESADFDGDGKTDFAVSNNSGTTFSIFRNTSSPGTVSFASSVDIQNGAGNKPFGMVVADLNNDGKNDIGVMIQNGSSSFAQLFRNTSTVGVIGFTFSTSATAGANLAYHLCAGDVNGDGKPDVVLGSTHLNKNVVFQNNSTGSSIIMGSGVDFFSLSPYTVVLADLDADSKPELLAGDFIGDEVSVFRNRSGLPGVTSFTPAIAGTGATVTITGDNFNGATSVTFGGVPASSFGIVNANTITAIVGTGASGDVIVTTALGAGSKAGFTFAAPPVISSFTPTGAGIGTTVTIIGSNFNGTTAVSFGGVAATSFSVVNATTITAVVGAGASGSVSVTNAFGTGSLPGFTYLVPVITSFSPISAGTGTVVTIMGNNLTGATAVSFGGTPATSFTVVSATSITAIVAGGSTGNVVVTTPIGTATLGGFTFVSSPPPVVTSFTPTAGNVGSLVTISGANFNTLTTSNIVYFGATRATVTSATASQLTVTVPPGSTFQFISVLNLANNLIGYSNTPFIPTFPNGGVINASSFPERLDISTFGGPSAGALQLEVGDLDDDGKPDIVFSFINGPLGICRNTGSAGVISFSPISYLTGFNSQQISLGDVDGDGKLDMLGVMSGSVVVARNTSSAGVISFAPLITLLSGIGDSEIGIEDMNGDGRPDIVLSFGGNLVMSVVRNTSTPGNISLGLKTDFTCLINPKHLRIGDLDGDGKKDIVISYGFGSDNISVYRNTGVSGAISFAPKIDYATGHNSGSIAIADIDGDNKQDICVANLSELFFSIYKNNGTAGTLSFEPRMDITTPANVFIKGVDIGDVDGDGKPDIVVAVDFTAPGILVYKNNSTIGTISVAMQAQIDSGNPWSTNLADMDGDNKPDIIGVIPGWNFISVFRNRVNIPVITSFSPNSGTTATSITISGNNFVGTTAISFGGIPAQSFTVNSATSITAIVGSGASGSVSVTTPAGIATKTGFSYFQLPTVTAFTPANGTTGTSVAITGSNFSGATIVSFGGVAAQSFVVNSSSSITAIVGTGASGNVVVANPVGSGSLAGFTFNTPPPTINAIAPGVGVAGISVTITGTNFIGVSAVRFGGVLAASFTVNSSTSITAVVGTGATGNVEVVTPAGTASFGAFTFLPTPTITSFSPTSGGQGTIMTINGTNFTFLQTIRIGGVPIASLISSNATTLVVTVGTGASGNVVVTTQGGGVASLPGFTYLTTPAPTISSFTPANAGTGGVVTITGTNLTGTTAVSFGGIAASSFTIVNATTITAVVGAGTSGNVSVTTPGGTVTLAGFIFVSGPGISSYTPLSGATGATITITGTNFTGATTVSFGGTPAASFTVVNATTITAVIGAGASGSVSVTTPGGTVSLPGFTFDVVTSVGGSNNNSIELLISPNPGKDLVVVTHPKSPQTSYLKLIDINGREVKQITVARNVTQTKIPVKGFAAGIYKLVWTGDKRILLRTLMISQ